MTTLKDLYIDELQDLWSANAQMSDVVSSLAAKASDRTLANRLSSAKKGIDEHSELLQDLLSEIDGAVKKDHCKGMEGLVKEARKHVMEGDLDGAALDVSIIAQ